MAKKNRLEIENPDHFLSKGPAPNVLPSVTVTVVLSKKLQSLKVPGRSGQGGARWGVLGPGQGGQSKNLPGTESGREPNSSRSSERKFRPVLVQNRKKLGHRPEDPGFCPFTPNFDQNMASWLILV